MISDRMIDVLGLAATYCIAVYRATCWLLWCGWVYLLWAHKPLHFSFHLLSHTLPAAALLLAAARVVVNGLTRLYWQRRHLRLRAREMKAASPHHIEFFPAEGGENHV